MVFCIADSVALYDDELSNESELLVGKLPRRGKVTCSRCCSQQLPASRLTQCATGMRIPRFCMYPKYFIEEMGSANRSGR
jgi:hypothetical protein